MLKTDAPYIADISIHALVKRATGYEWRAIEREVYFNPRPREEGDVTHAQRSAGRGHFNPRPREEGDPAGNSVLRD